MMGYAKQSSGGYDSSGLLRRFAPRNDDLKARINPLEEIRSDTAFFVHEAAARVIGS